MNGRGGVSPETVQKVILAARALDYQRRLPEAHHGIIRIEVLLVRPETTFYSRVARAFDRIAATLDRSVAVHRTFLDEDDPAAIAKHIANPSFRRAGLIICVPDHPLVLQALGGVGDLPVIQIVSRIAGLAADYVGADNYAVGRTAALLVTRMQQAKGTVVAIGHSGVYDVHRERLRGFSDYFAEHRRRNLAFRRVLLAHDEARRTRELLAQALRDYPDLVAVYNSGGGNSSATDVLRKHPRRGEIFFIGHELTERSAAALKDGTMAVVLDQAPEAQARRAMDLMLSKLGLHTEEIENPPIRCMTITSENI